MVLHSGQQKRNASDLVERLEGVKADAEARGFATLAYFIETAIIEARLQARFAIDDGRPGRTTVASHGYGSRTHRADSV